MLLLFSLIGLSLVVAQDPLILTQYLNQPDLGQNLSQVVGIDPRGFISYSGFFTVNAKYNSNMYFWVKTFIFKLILT
jgi:hypothetical protein